MLADRLAARTERGDRHLQRHPEVVIVARDAGAEGAGVVQEPDRPRDRRFLLDEIGERDLDARRVRVVVAAQLRAERAELADVDLPPVAVQDFDEAARVRGLALVWHGY